MDSLAPWLLDFADVDTVYLTYGKFYLLCVLAVLACAVAAYSRRPAQVGWVGTLGVAVDHRGLRPDERRARSWPTGWPSSTAGTP